MAIDCVQSCEKCLLSLLAEISAECGESPALLASNGPGRSFVRLESHIRGVGKTLAFHGLGGDSRVAIILPDSADAAVVMMGVMAHAVALPLNPRMPAEELARSLRVLRAQAVIISHDAAADSIRRVASELSLLTFSVVPDNGGVSDVLAANFRPNLNEAIESPSPRCGDDVAMIVCTSGTTGRAKIVPLTHNNLLSMMLANCQVLQLTPEDRCLSIMPLYHIHGLGAVLCSILSGGSVVVSAGGFAAEAFFNLMDEFEPNWYTAVPTIHRAILHHAPAHESTITAIAARGGLKFVRSGSAPMPPGFPARLEALFHSIYIEASGATEASAYICSNRPGRRKIGSVGLPMPGTEVRILDESLRPVGAGVTGELAAHGPGIFRGYEGDTEHSCFADGFFRTGDLGHYDADGFFYITGRLKEQINRAGSKISPTEVDEILLKHPSVAEAVTFAIPNDRLGQEVGAAIVLKAGMSVTELELQRFTAQHLVDYKVPQRIVFIKEIPKTSNGKIVRVEMAKRLGLIDQTQVIKENSEPTKTSPTKKLMTPLEQTIAAIYSDILHHPISDVETSLHDLGADSLQAVHICLGLERRFLRTIPLAALTAHSSVRAVAQLLSKDEMAMQPGSPITLRDGTAEGPQLFLFPGVGGNIYSYHGLARKLPSDWRVIGLPLPGADGLEKPLTSMSELVTRFIKTVEPVAQSKPCILMGYSFGGRVAFELASRLISAGVSSPILILCDIPAPGWPPPLPLLNRIPIYLSRIRRDGLFATIRRLHEAKKHTKNIHSDGYPDEGMGALLLGHAPGRQLEIENKLRAAYNIAAREWHPSPMQLKIHLFRASESIRRAYDLSDPQMGWLKYAQNGVRVYRVPGTHGTIFHEENVGVMADQTIKIVDRELHSESIDASVLASAT